MAIAYPLINGFRHSWASVEIRVAGNLVFGISEVNYSVKIDPGVVRGAGTQPIGYTQGNSEYEGDFTILLAEFTELQNILGPTGFMNTFFDIIVSYEASPDLPVVVDTLQGCLITGTDSNASNGSTDGLVRKCTIKPMRILLNGFLPGAAQPTAAV